MKIIYVGTGTQSISPMSETAVEIVTNKLAEVVKELGNEVYVIDIFSDKANNNLNYYRINMPNFLREKNSNSGSIYHILKRILFSIKSLKLIHRLRKKEKIDIVHIQNQYPGLIILIFKKFFKDISFVYTDHTPFWVLEKKEFNKKFYFKTMMDRISMKLSDKLVFVGESQKKGILEKVNINKDKSRVIQNGVDLDRFKPLNKNRSDDKIKMLYVARMSRVKNQLLILKALNEMKNKDNIILDFIGQIEDLEYYNEILDYIKDNKLENINIIGPVKNDLLPKYYRESDIFISPSNAEGFPLTVLEAMSSGCALLLSDIGPHLELKGESAIYFTKDNYVNLKDKIENLIKNRNNLNKLKRKSRKSAEKHYSWKKVAKDYIKFYKN
jgi:glycosyltransferase involved in cell wall biosynthesis